MKGQQVEFQGKKYRCVLYTLDVFSWYHWLAPLTSKHVTKIAIELKKIYDIHGTPENLQSDRDKELYGTVKIFCERKKDKSVAISRQSPKIPQNTKKEDKLRSCEAGLKRC